MYFIRHTFRKTYILNICNTSVNNTTFYFIFTGIFVRAYTQSRQQPVSVA